MDDNNSTAAASQPRGLLDEGLISEADLAERLGWTRDWLGKRRRRGEMPDHIKQGRTILYPRPAVETWLRAGLHSTDSGVA
ncbi:DNA-binding protein [Brevibacterium sp. S111]|uniref:helix-turn-helix transcriptional regulator n=1 Tax=Brevibacterium sp. S111 TaxID=2483795 RepID=UPI001081F270|nr:DNA-binding protein [Brevibacterium sp. S111]TGD12075.1 DNA-binding protein [Brevibacterium sp. S111]